jgi:uncharacterized membrane protein HdeD (DUF308 family)
LDNRVLGIIGLIGGVLAIVGFFGTWYWIKYPLGAGIPSTSFSGWGATQTIKQPYFVIIGGVVMIVCSVIALFKPRFVTKVLFALGGILIFIGGASGLSLLWPVSYGSVRESASYGAYLVAIAGTLAIFVALGLKDKMKRRTPKS